MRPEIPVPSARSAPCPAGSSAARPNVNVVMAFPRDGAPAQLRAAPRATRTKPSAPGGRCTSRSRAMWRRSRCASRSAHLRQRRAQRRAQPAERLRTAAHLRCARAATWSRAGTSAGGAGVSAPFATCTVRPHASVTTTRHRRASLASSSAWSRSAVSRARSAHWIETPRSNASIRSSRSRYGPSWDRALAAARARGLPSCNRFNSRLTCWSVITLVPRGCPEGEPKQDRREGLRPENSNCRRHRLDPAGVNYQPHQLRPSSYDNYPKVLIAANHCAYTGQLAPVLLGASFNAIRNRLHLETAPLATQWSIAFTSSARWPPNVIHLPARDARDPSNRGECAESRSVDRQNPRQHGTTRNAAPFDHIARRAAYTGLSRSPAAP